MPKCKLHEHLEVQASPDEECKACKLGKKTESEFGVKLEVPIFQSANKGLCGYPGQGVCRSIVLERREPERRPVTLRFGQAPVGSGGVCQRDEGDLGSVSPASEEVRGAASGALRGGTGDPAKRRDGHEVASPDQYTASNQLGDREVLAAGAGPVHRAREPPLCESEAPGADSAHQ